jgi:hypothetical protein
LTIQQRSDVVVSSLCKVKGVLVVLVVDNFPGDEVLVTIDGLIIPVIDFDGGGGVVELREVELDGVSVGWDVTGGG